MRFMISTARSRLLACSALALGAAACGSARPLPVGARTPARSSARVPAISCFLLRELGVGEVRRAPAVGCAERVTPASTFKIPHALAALDAGVVANAETVFAYDGSPFPFESWRRDHTLASAMRNSVVWYFQRVADALGPAREREYLARFHYGNEDASGNPRRFWLEDSLLIAPDEQCLFLERLYTGALPVRRFALETVRDILVQPEGTLTNAAGSHPFGAPWPPETVVSAKTGRGDYDGLAVHWVVGSVRRATRTWLFVSCVTGRFAQGQLPARDLAVEGLRAERVL